MEIPVEHTIQIRVRYSETDAMGLLHHSNYLAYLEVGRTELFRIQGGNYRRMEELGLFFVVAKHLNQLQKASWLRRSAGSHNSDHPANACSN